MKIEIEQSTRHFEDWFLTLSDHEDSCLYVFSLAELREIRDAIDRALETP